ncbi:DUF3592 domain-containing protein [Streptomyces sp. NPDC002004]
MDIFFYGIPGLMIAGALFFAYAVVRRARDLSAAWDSGLVAEGRCLRTYTTVHSSGEHSRTSTTLHHVYEFTTRDGRAFRFEEEDGPGTTVEGDIVPVHYTAERPEKATARPPRKAVTFAGTAGLLVFLGVFIAFCVGFMVMYGAASDGDDVFGGQGAVSVVAP